MFRGTVLFLTGRTFLSALSSTPRSVAGLGLRRGYLQELADLPAGRVDFLELAPENWLGVGGRLGRTFGGLAERYSLALHGLSPDIGGTAPRGRPGPLSMPFPRCPRSPGCFATAGPSISSVRATSPRRRPRGAGAFARCAFA
ncbi:MAG: multinuclear nonheme iron-dependent oxidase [Pseudohaliea sp.]